MVVRSTSLAPIFGQNAWSSLCADISSCPLASSSSDFFVSQKLFTPSSCSLGRSSCAASWTASPTSCLLYRKRPVRTVVSRLQNIIDNLKSCWWLLAYFWSALHFLKQILCDPVGPLCDSLAGAQVDLDLLAERRTISWDLSLIPHTCEV